MNGFNYARLRARLRREFENTIVPEILDGLAEALGLPLEEVQESEGELAGAPADASASETAEHTREPNASELVEVVEFRNAAGEFVPASMQDADGQAETITHHKHRAAVADTSSHTKRQSKGKRAPEEPAEHDT